MRLPVFLALLTILVACTQERRIDVAALRPCDTLDRFEGLTPGECRLEANGETLHVKFAAPPERATGGVVSVEVIGADGDVRQVLLEDNVSEYLTPSVQDVDGDGRGDLLVPRETGNVNTVNGVWVFTGDGLYRRAGEVSGVQVSRTDDGLIAVPSRGGAASWNVAFYRLDEAGLGLTASVNIEAQEGRGGAIETRCALADAPGLVSLGLSAQAAEAKFCAEPVAAGVFGP